MGLKARTQDRRASRAPVQTPKLSTMGSSLHVDDAPHAAEKLSSVKAA